MEHTFDALADANADAQELNETRGRSKADARTKENTQQPVQMAATRVK